MKKDTYFRVYDEQECAEVELAKLKKKLGSLYGRVAPIINDYPLVIKWECLGDGYIKGTWAEDGSPYQLKVPCQLADCFIALQELAMLTKQPLPPVPAKQEDAMNKPTEAIVDLHRYADYFDDTKHSDDITKVLTYIAELERDKERMVKTLNNVAGSAAEYLATRKSSVREELEKAIDEAGEAIDAAKKGEA